MKRWLVVVLVLLALLVLLAPGIVGRMAEQNIAQNIEWAESDNPGITIETEQFDRGWFTSEGRHRIVVDAGQFREVADDYADATGNAELPSLVIDTRLAHGPLPGGSGSPGLATTESTFKIDPGNGELIDVPGRMTSRVSLSGDTDGQLAIDSGSFEDDDNTVSWQGADMLFQSNPSTGDFTVEGEIRPWKITGEDGAADFGALAITADQVRSDFGFNVGTIDMQMGEIVLADASSTVTIGGASFTADTEIADDRVSGTSAFTIDAVTVPAFGEMSYAMEITVRDADAAAIHTIAEALEDTQNAADPEAALANIYSEIEPDLETLVGRGFSISIDRLDVTLPQGVVATRMDVTVPESDAQAFDWGSVLLNTTATLDLRVPAAVYQMAAMMSPEAGSLVSMGFLRQEGDEFVMEAEYAQGLINVNGAPLPMPIPGLQ
jgi:uncharacterized protein YdgA (DUF945 family)